MKTTTFAQKIKITGLVQGVGFRPFVYHMAVKNAVAGWVENNNEGVTIHAEAGPQRLKQFLADLKTQAPEAASIREISIAETPLHNFIDFTIRKSSSYSQLVTEVSPDIAVCSACLSDMVEQPHRINYPFINCTNCGPRFTIIEALPYDRHQTTMRPFTLCKLCQTEYKNLYDRRFHAQPVACLNCGPAYQLKEGERFTDGKVLAQFLSSHIEAGKIVALKGLGGFHLMCSAHNNEALSLLRKRKARDGKPMAVMVKNTQKAAAYFQLSPAEKKALENWRRPILLLKNKLPLAFELSRGLNTTGVMLPYMPFHYQLFDQLKVDVLVMTSGNIADEPVIIDDKEAFDKLEKIADIIVGYNRAIHNRVDDSVAFVVNEKSRLIRRSRSFVPAPITLAFDAEHLFAAGAELVNTFAIGKARQAIISQHIGDLKNVETLAFYEESFARFKALFRFKPQLAVCDLHPDYLSTHFVQNLGIETLKVQHHHAHIASCMAEHGLDEKVIGIALDGTGLGTDGTIWGGEYFICDLSDFSRQYYFDPVPLPGGDKVTDQPWRTAFSYLYKYFGLSIFIDENAMKLIPDQKDLPLLMQIIDQGINSPLSSGAGRLFDAVAALTGICTQSSFHAEAPMRLEAAIKENCQGKYLFEIDNQTISFRKMFYKILEDMKAGISAGEIAAKFHNTIIVINLKIVNALYTKTGINKVVLSGGSFQNRYLLEHTENILQKSGFEVFAHQKVPTNDGGISLGQLAIGAKYLQRQTENK
ncbi:MAG: carbamoyltransferase HypF [Bacteroidales bacterium]|jgi:hydrogenase maturation protein HypF|nr:carbamoyltransferase HypF [Bacteroidales bacterium]